MQQLPWVGGGYRFRVFGPLVLCTPPPPKRIRGGRNYPRRYMCSHLTEPRFKLGAPIPLLLFSFWIKFLEFGQSVSRSDQDTLRDRKSIAKNLLRETITSPTVVDMTHDAIERRGVDDESERHKSTLHRRPARAPFKLWAQASGLTWQPPVLVL